MSAILSELLERLEPDDWRRENGFSDDMESANGHLFADASTTKTQEDTLNQWLRSYQPCLFGKAAATQNALTYCILNERDVLTGDTFVRDQVARAHLKWSRSAFEGRSSGFVVAFVSRRMAYARPCQTVLEFAKRLAQLYLQEDEIEPDRIYHDNVYLAIPDHRERVLKWKAGVNYFSAHGDRRWWQDHRIPGGIAFSTNSVGHLVKSGKVLALLAETTAELGLTEEERGGPRLDSLGRALHMAMQTINNASEAVSGKATELLPLPLNRAELPVQQCPIDLVGRLTDKNFCSYRGYYHTDHTLPGVYFREDIERSADLQVVEPLDLTYLFNNTDENPAFITMGSGIPIRDGDEVKLPAYKRGRFEPVEVDISSDARLIAALSAEPVPM